jgi:beta-N-acetylhexosaminidase
VHQGGEGKVAVVAKHFPGLGGSDRRADEEVATVQKSLQELRKIELAPFFAVTQLKEDDPLAMADALMTSHIRYRGFQGNIRQLTRPISFDPQALQALMALSEFEPWRSGGGLMVSNALGVPAVRKYYDPQLQTFPHKRIAQEAFLAGNDLLMLSQFALSDSWPEQLENIKATIQFFREKYLSDPNFQTRVDGALRRILSLKHRLYPDFALEAVQVDVENLAEVVGQGREAVFQVAQEAITLIYPGPDELADRLPSPPLIDENILIFSDDRQASDCPVCEPLPPALRA